VTGRTASRIAAVLGFLAVALGAIGAHALKKKLALHDAVGLWEKAVFYHAIHAVVLFVLAGRTPLRRGPYLGFVAGIVLFSGSLYALALTKASWLGAITPFGGVSFLAGWLWLVIAPSPQNGAAKDLPFH
jgi:uncharacterized membrane protein YgdD (TMEM256/DUF423 family)